MRQPKQSKTDKTKRTRIYFLVPKHDDEEAGEDGMMLDPEDVQLIYNALRTYKPIKDEEHLQGILLKQIEEVIAGDPDGPHSDAN